MPTALPGAGGALPPAERSHRVGVLLANLGTPDAPTPSAVRRYLREFLADPRVVEANPLLWRAALELVVLPRRSARSARAYAAIWTDQGSPLLYHSRRAADSLAARLGDRFAVALGMRYGRPTLAAALDELRAAECERVILLPMFPQYSNATTGSLQVALWRAAARLRHPPAITVVPAYFDHPAYVDALAARVREIGVEDTDLVVVSFHGLPRSYVERGDPYLDHCTRTAWSLAERLALPRERWTVAFQSRFGRAEWLAPALDELVVSGARRWPRVLVVAPSFTTDGLETLEEIGLRLDAAFRAAGGRRLTLVPALNDHPSWIDALERLVQEHAGAPARKRKRTEGSQHPGLNDA